MSTNWLFSKKNEFVTDLLRNFCIIQKILSRLFDQYYKSGQIDFDELADLLGQEMNQGRLWRLKDSAHLLFSKFPDQDITGQFLDWSIGYIFHECMKLKEDAYQMQNYVPWFESIREDINLNKAERDIAQSLFQLISQTRESIRREIERINFILDKCKTIFINFLPHQRDNFLLARFIYDQNAMVQEVFNDYYQELIKAIYGNSPEDLYLFAAQSLRQGGWIKKAEQALQEAISCNPYNPNVLKEKKIIANQLTKS